MKELFSWARYSFNPRGRKRVSVERNLGCTLFNSDADSLACSSVCSAPPNPEIIITEVSIPAAWAFSIPSTIDARVSDLWIAFSRLSEPVSMPIYSNESPSERNVSSSVSDLFAISRGSE